MRICLRFRTVLPRTAVADVDAYSGPAGEQADLARSSEAG